MGKILVFGATGYIGKYLTTTLASEGKEVFGFGRNKNVLGFLEKNGVKTVSFDALNDEDYKKIPADDVDAIINLAVALPEYEVPLETFFDVNMTGNRKLLEFAHANGIDRFIMTSTHKVYYDVYKDLIDENELPCFIGPHSPYIISKLAAENFMQWYSKDFDMDCIVLRLTGVQGYGALMGFLAKDGSYRRSATELWMEQALKGETIEVWGDMSIKRDHIYIKDVVSALEAAVYAPKGTKGIFNVASGKGRSQYEDAVAIAGAFASDGKRSEVVLREDKPGLTRGYVYSIDKIKRTMNWSPKYTDLADLYSDYRIERERGIYRNCHYIKDADRPMVF